MHVTCETWPRAKLPPEFSGVAEGLAGVLQLKDMMSPRGVATRTCDASGENETEVGGGGGGGGGGLGGVKKKNSADNHLQRPPAQ
jgi:hypothetical protein